MRGSYRKRRIDSPPRFYRFKPAGIPSRSLKSLILTIDEFEAIRLADYSSMEHQEAATQMNISRPTFTRLIEKARQKVAQALMEGAELIVEGGNIEFVNNLFKCHQCGTMNKRPIDTRIHNCPKCNSSEMDDLASKHLGNS